MNKNSAAYIKQDQEHIQYNNILKLVYWSHIRQLVIHSPYQTKILTTMLIFCLLTKTRFIGHLPFDALAYVTRCSRPTVRASFRNIEFY